MPQDGQTLMAEKPDTEAMVKEKLASLQTMWDELESTTQTKAKCLFDANKAELFTQSCADLDKWLGGLEAQLQSDDYGKDLTSVNILLKKQQVRTRFPFSVNYKLYICTMLAKNTLLLTLSAVRGFPCKLVLAVMHEGGETWTFDFNSRAGWAPAPPFFRHAPDSCYSAQKQLFS